ncbi:hypothetical protein EB118_25900, partial [bacterium]|nr:hypothetical protein [bacterium]
TLSVGTTTNTTTIQIGITSSAVAQTINIGNNTTASSSTALTMGSLIGASPTVVQGGSSGVAIRSAGAGNITFGTNGVTRATFDNNYYDPYYEMYTQSLTFLQDYGIRGGAGTFGNNLTVQGGFGNTSGSGWAGTLTLAGGDGYNGVGDVSIRGGDSYGGFQSGGNVVINGGCQMASGGGGAYCPGDNTTAGSINIGTYLAKSVNLGGNAINLQPAGSGNIVIGSVNGTANLLVLDTKNTSGDPTGTIANGSMYYNSNLGKFRCYQASAWKDCDVASSSSSVLQGGNSFGEIMQIGTNDAYALNFETAGSTKLTLDTTGNLSFANGANRTISVAQAASGNGNNLTIASGASNVGIGGTLTLQGANVSGSGNTGGNVLIQSGSNASVASGS